MNPRERINGVAKPITGNKTPASLIHRKSAYLDESAVALAKNVFDRKAHIGLQDIQRIGEKAVQWRTLIRQIGSHIGKFSTQREPVEPGLCLQQIAPLKALITALKAVAKLPIQKLDAALLLESDRQPIGQPTALLRVG